MADSNVVDRMRKEWNERAREDPNYYVAFGSREQDDADVAAPVGSQLRRAWGSAGKNCPGRPGGSGRSRNTTATS